MKNKSFIFYALAVAFLFCNTVAFSQKNKEKPLDSTLEADSEKWKVKEHKGIAGIAKPEFGNYTALVAEKLDSPVIKKKRKDSSGTEISYSEGWDIRKYKTIEKIKFYRMLLGKDSDTAEAQFYIQTVSSEKRQTLLGKMLSKNDEDKDATLKYQKNIKGIIFTRGTTEPARFFIEDYLSTRQITNDNPGQDNPITGGYILIKTDSLFTEPAMQSFGDLKNKFFFHWQKGIFINDMTGHIGLLQFGSDQPFYIRIRKDLDAEYQDAIAAFFAVIIGVKGL